MKTLVAFLLLTSARAQWLALPPAPTLTPEGLALILDGETGGERQYNTWPHPEWPKGASGVTWAIGYDATAQSRSLILDDWQALPTRFAVRLADTHPFRGQAARRAAAALRDVTVPWDLAIDVFTRIDVSRTDQLCRRMFPGFDDLRPHAQDAIRSLAFNRGICFVGDRFLEMRWIRDAVPDQDYARMAFAERHMERIWPPGNPIHNGMKNRREAEAILFLTP
jgi:hypothetical protein